MVVDNSKDTDNNKMNLNDYLEKTLYTITMDNNKMNLNDYLEKTLMSKCPTSINN